MSRPTRGVDVEADLRARADFRGINEAGQIHYLFGMATQLLAQANAELDRLERRFVGHLAIRDALCDCAALLDDYSDVIDGEDGPLPNRAMSLLRDVEAALEMEKRS